MNGNEEEGGESIAVVGCRTDSERSCVESPAELDLPISQL